jgi:hypothetical protein
MPKLTSAINQWQSEHRQSNVGGIAVRSGAMLLSAKAA